MTDSENEPVHLLEDAETGDRFLVYGTDKGFQLDIRYQGDALWMTQAQIAQLFGRDQSVISRHINNIIEEQELDETSNMQKVHIAGATRPTALYSLDMVISVGYRVSSAQVTVFRRWATGVLVQFATKGFVVDARRLKQAENADRVAELRDIIRDIRTEAARDFYQRTQVSTDTSQIGLCGHIADTLGNHCRQGKPRIREHGFADLAKRQHPKNRRHRLQELSQ